jgi:hypothetical protein
MDTPYPMETILPASMSPPVEGTTKGASPAFTYTVRPADLQRDRNAILEVWARNLANSALGPESYAWYYQHNPYGEGRCWLLLAEPGNKVVGTAGLGLRRIKVGTKTILAGLASDFAVDREHRSLLPALLLQKALLGARNEELRLIYGVPNDRAQGIFRHLGYNAVGTKTRHVKVLRIADYLQRLPRPFQCARAAAWVYDQALRLHSVAIQRLQPRDTLTVLPVFDSRFDDLWERSSTHYPVIAERTTAFLRWRYTECPLRDYFTVGLLARRENALRGYAVCYLEAGHLHCLDILTEDNGPTLETLMRELIHFGRKQGAKSISLSAVITEPMESLLHHLGFVLREDAVATTVLISPHTSCPLNTESLQQWYFMSGDEDYN